MPHLTEFDRIVLGLSGGKDSTAALLWLIHDAGVDPTRIVAAFCDTGNEDPLTLAFIALMEHRYAPLGVQFVTVEPEQDFWALARQRGRFPSLKARFCTQMLKIVPTRTLVHDLLQQHAEVVVVNGVRRAEGRASNTRAQATPWELDMLGFGTWLHRPLLDWTLTDVIALHRRHIPIAEVITLVAADRTLTPEHKAVLTEQIRRADLPLNPLYAMGARRVGCFPCVNSGKREVAAVAYYRPAQIAHIAAEELTVGRDGFSSFFRATTVPRHLRSRTVTRHGQCWHVPTVQDVARWATTAHGGLQIRLEATLPPASACDHGGWCE